MKITMATLTAILAFTACTTSTDTERPDSRTVSASTDPKTITLQLGDLPDGFTEAGSVVEADAEDLDDKRASGEVPEDLYEWVRGSGFVAFATRQFSRNDEQIASTAVIFRTADEADAFYDKEPPKQVLEDAPQVGDESFTEHVESGPSPLGENEQIVDSELIRTRARVGNVVIEFIYSDDAGEIDQDEAFVIARRAAGRVR